MFKRIYILLPIMVFAFFTIKQLIFNDEIQWFYNIGLSIFVYFGYVLWVWLQTPYKRNKDNGSN